MSTDFGLSRAQSAHDLALPPDAYAPAENTQSEALQFILERAARKCNVVDWGVEDLGGERFVRFEFGPVESPKELVSQVQTFLDELKRGGAV